MRSTFLSHTKRISGFPIGYEEVRSISYLIPSVLAAFLIGYEEVRSISNPPADVCLGGGFAIDVSAAAIMKRFGQIYDENVNKK